MTKISELQEWLEEVEEMSEHNGYWYSVSDALIIIVIGSLCGLRTIMEIYTWATSKPTRQFLAKEFGMETIMSKSQFYNILGIVNAEAFKRCFVAWMQGILSNALPGKTISIDGKTVCGTDKLTKDGSILNIVSAYVSELKLTIGSHECSSKPGERRAFRELLAMLNLADTIVVADALHCNKPAIDAIIKAEADYLLVVKNNVPALKKDIQTCLTASQVKPYTTKEYNGGRHEIRTAYATTEISHIKCKKRWPNITTVGAIHRQFEKDGQTSDEWHFYISSASLSSEKMLYHARMEWGIESMHWLLDVHFTEDKMRIFDMNIQTILNIVRKIALNLIQIYKASNCKPNTSLSSIMRKNLFDSAVLADFLLAFSSHTKLE